MNTLNYNELAFKGSAGRNERPQNRSREFRVYDVKTGGYTVLERPEPRDSFEHEQELKKKELQRQRKLRAERQRKRQIQKRKENIKKGVIGTLAALTIGAGVHTAVQKPAENVQITPEIVASESIAAEPETETFSFEQGVGDILGSDPEAKEAYDNIVEALDTYSKQMGTDGLSLIKSRVEEIGGGEVNVTDVLKILWIESRGNVYNENGEILPSYTNEAFGPFQLTPDTVDYLNGYWGLSGTENELDVMNPYDNLDACIYNLRFLKQLKQETPEENYEILGSDDIMKAVFWGYHDGAWADKLTDNGEYYLAQYDSLSAIDKYTEVTTYIENGLC